MLVGIENVYRSKDKKFNEFAKNAFPALKLYASLNGEDKEKAKKTYRDILHGISNAMKSDKYCFPFTGEYGGIYIVKTDLKIDERLFYPSSKVVGQNGFNEYLEIKTIDSIGKENEYGG